VRGLIVFLELGYKNNIMKKQLLKICIVIFSTLLVSSNHAQNLSSPQDYCIPVADCSSYGISITDFAFAGIENYESGCSDNGYGDFTDLVAELTGGETYTVSIATGFINEYMD